jgi:hypothetical protein
VSHPPPLSFLSVGWTGNSQVAMSYQRSLKIESFRFAAFVPKKIKYIRFLKRIETKRFLLVLEKFGPKAFVLVRF